ncbi:MAG: T9SS type A sorting domain-containing protein [Bacteroidia bacterium]
MPGAYSLTITDDQGCELSVYKYIQNASPVHVDLSGSYIGCDENSGSLTANATSGTTPYTYAFSNGETSGVNSVSGLNPGWYSVYVTDAQGCTGYDNVQLYYDAACYISISGRVFNDLNGNCIQDAGESGLPNVLVNATPGYHYATTNSQGYYSISALPGDYDLNVYSPANWNQICPDVPGTISVSAGNPGQAYGGNNFYLQPDSVFNDISVVVSSGPARPGFPLHWYATVRNLGTTTLTPVLTLEHDALASYTGSNPSVSSYNAATHTATWNVSPMPPLTTRNYYLYTTLSTAALIGDSVHATGNVALSSAASEVNFDNNTDYYARLVTGSYDPNDKAVEPRGLGDEGYIMPDETTLHYRVRFQNTGTDTAFTVVIRDTLDPSLDVPSFVLDESSHDIEYEITGEGYLTFTFNNILLPDSFVNEPASHGLVSYFINLKEDVVPMTEIRNTAAIYFDFNPPVYTNTTLNTVFDITTSVVENADFTAGLMPNPSNGNSMLNLNLPVAGKLQIQLSDLSGRVVLDRQFGTLAARQHAIPVNGLPSGVYMLNIRSGNLYKSLKMVVTR